LRAIKDIFELADLYDHGVILEYQLPLSSKRLDCLICGKDDNKNENAVIIDLKHWEKSKEADGENEVCTYVGGALREVLHPSAQVGQYKMYLEDTPRNLSQFHSPKNLSIRECCENTNMDCNISVCACRHSQKTPQSESESVYNFTDFKCVSF
jgi:hypothetical protein